MKKKWLKFIIIFFSASLLSKCIDPYTPNLGNFKSLLVVDALLTDEYISNYVRLSRTIKSLDEEPERVTGAFVVISDDAGNKTTLNEIAAGEYRTDSLIFRGIPGRTYTLYIKTPEGEEYESAPSRLYPVREIDSIYFRRDTEVPDDGSELREGISILIDSGNESEQEYFRWTYEEWWKFEIPDPVKYTYISDSEFIPIPIASKTCWSNKKSDEIMIHFAETGNPVNLDQKNILFIDPAKSNRLLIQYSINVKQLSISAQEYAFWNNMKLINESGGDIFDKQPFSITGNISNIDRPQEQVLGYFQVSAVTKRSMYITVDQILELGLPLYRYDCIRIEKGEEDYESIGPGKFTFNEIYFAFTNSGYTFIEPVWGNPGELRKLSFAPTVCTDCTLSGMITKPDFWTDLY